MLPTLNLSVAYFDPVHCLVRKRISKNHIRIQIPPFEKIMNFVCMLLHELMCACRETVDRTELWYNTHDSMKRKPYRTNMSKHLYDWDQNLKFTYCRSDMLNKKYYNKCTFKTA